MRQLFRAMVLSLLLSANIAYSQQCKKEMLFVSANRYRLSNDSTIVLAKKAVCTCSLEGNTTLHIIALSTLSDLYSNTTKKDSCLKYAVLAMDLYKKNSFSDINFYCRLLLCLGFANEKNDAMEKALLYYNEAGKLLEKSLSDPAVDSESFIKTYFDCLNYIAVCYMNFQLFSKAQKQFDKISKSMSFYPRLPEGQIINTLNNQAGFYNLTGEYSRALKINNEAFDRYKTLTTNHPTDSLFYSTLLNNLGNSYQLLGVYPRAIPYFQESFRIRQRLFDQKSEYYFTALNNLGTTYLNMGRDNEALVVFKTLDSISIPFGLTSKQHLLALTNLTMSYSNAGDKKNVLKTALNLFELSKKSRLTSSEDFALSIGILGDAYRQNRNFTKAVLFLDSSRVMLSKIPDGGGDPSSIFIVENNLGSAYIALKLYSKAIRLYKNLLQNHIRKFPMSQVPRVSYLNNLVAAYAANNNINEALPYIESAVKEIKFQLQNRLGIQSEYEKEKYLNQINEIFNIYKSFISIIPLAKRSEYVSLIYDNELLLKSFILNSSNKIRNAILVSNDKSLLALYDEWKDSKLTLHKQSISNSVNKDLQIKISELERQLSNRSKVFNDDFNAMNIGWRQVQANLKENEIVVEFFYYRKFSNKLKTFGTFDYGAVLLKKEFKRPVWVPLFSESKLDKLLTTGDKSENVRDKINSIYGDVNITGKDTRAFNITNKNLYNLIWQPLTPYFNHIKQVFFVPSRKLNAISLLALHDSKQFLIDKYQFKQLLSSRDIFSLRQPVKDLESSESLNIQIDKLSLLGNIAYNVPLNNGPTGKDKLVIDSSKFYSDLPYTGLEVRSIDSIMRQSGYHSTVYSGQNANEELIKSFDKHSPEILNIATHGFFYPLSEGNGNSDTASLDYIFKYSHDPMLRSGLLLASANFTLGGGKTLNNQEDGILTADEVSLLDLSNTKLLVLSACETGIGEIKGSEGVFGLQRAFKLAGVRHMVVSLWKVSEKATFKFMETFYTQLAKNKDIFQSFQDSQIIMKKTYNPYFWSGFVLIW
jgi:CHAT domain-containing protein